MDLATQIAEIPLFKGLPRDQLDKLTRIAIDKKYRKGQTLFLEGSRATGFYTITAGRIKVFKVSLEGKEQILHIFGKGEFFGEVPMFAGGNYPAHAETLEASRVLFFPRDSFTELLTREPSLALNMLGILSQRLRRFTQLIEDLSLREVPGRLAAYFLYLSSRQKDSDSFSLDITKAQLASFLGTIPETLSRILSRMIQHQCIQMEGRKIKVIDRSALESLAAGEKLLS
jgi:CRP/FNR family transcriptional regulator